MNDKEQRLRERPAPRSGSVAAHAAPVRAPAPPPITQLPEPEPRPPTPPSVAPATEPRASNRKAVYTVIEQGNRPARWVRVGIAFVNRDASLNVVLDALPANATLHIRDFPAREGGDGGEE